MTLSHPHSQVLYQKCFISKHCNYTNLGLSALWVEFLSLGVSLLSVFQHIHREDYCSALQKYPDTCLRRLWEREPCPRHGNPQHCRRGHSSGATAVQPRCASSDFVPFMFSRFFFDMFASLESLK